MMVRGEWGDELPRFCIANLTEAQVRLLRALVRSGANTHRTVNRELTGTDRFPMAVEELLMCLSSPVEQIMDELRGGLIEGEDP